jgi:glycosyltransferase involved in cell wall biosynthesis
MTDLPSVHTALHSECHETDSGMDEGNWFGSREPLVSVVIPVYNGERFLGAAIESVLHQSLQDLEIIVVDDGSTDATPQILAAYASRIRVYRQPNRGVASARNAGAARARGTYLAFLDADDVWLREKLARQMPLFASPDVALVYAGVRVVDSDLRLIRELEPPAPELALSHTLCVEPSPLPLTMTGVVRRAAFADVGGFDERLSTSADADFVCRVALRYRLQCIAEPLALYRQHGTQMHLNVEAMERDMATVHAKFFGDPASAAFQDLRGDAVASVYYTLALGYAHRRRIPAALRCLVTAIRWSPMRVLRLFAIGLRRRLQPPV